MSNLSLDDLFVLAEASCALDRVEKDLRDRHRTGQANVLHKLQQDAGVAIAREMDPGYDPKAGQETAKLDRAFAPVTRGRVEVVLQEAFALAGAETRPELSALMSKMKVEPLPTPAAIKAAAPAAKR